MARFKSLPRLPGIKQAGGKTKKRFNRPDPIHGDFIRDLRDPHVMEVFNRLGRQPRDWKLAQRVARLMVDFPGGTIPELVTYDWLKQKDIPFTYQAWIAGGRSRKGGVVPDIVLSYAGKGMAWLIQGIYFHSKPDISASDKVDIMTIKGSWFHNIYIEEVVELWEPRIYRDRPQIFEYALLGIEMGP